MKKDLLSIRDLTVEDVNLLIEMAERIKADIPAYYEVLLGHSIV